MKNLVLSGLLLFGGIMISLRAHKTRGIILMLTLLLIVSATVFTNLYDINLSKFTQNIEEYSEGSKPTDNLDYRLDTVTENKAKELTDELIKKAQTEIKEVRETLVKRINELNLKSTLTADESQEQKELAVQKKTIDANVATIKTEYNRRFADTEGVDASDQACKLILKFPPAPSFNTITGKASNNVINQIKFEWNGVVSESGVGTEGTNFTYKCPNESHIVAYDYNNDPKVDGNIIDSASIFGGIGPVYCSDGSRIKNTYGKPKTQTINKRPTGTGLSTYDYLLDTGFDETLPGSTYTGSVKGVSADTCGRVCSAMKDACRTTSFNGANKDNGNCYFSKNAFDSSFTGTNIKDSRIYVKIS
jgi:hypothetical protein